jgi:hypothetical protein
LPSLIARVLVVIGSFLLASLVAATLIAVGVLLPEWADSTVLAAPATAAAVIGHFTLLLARAGLVPFGMLIALAEGFRLRSPFLYVGAAVGGMIALYYGFGFAQRTATAAVPMRRELEIMIGAGIAAGFLYWLLAGRKAGAWRESRRAD